MADRTILHCDINNFYASVECLRFPMYADKPLAVCGDPEKRHGVVLAKNNVAKRAGIKTGDVIWQARQKCAGLILVPPHFEDYVRLSEQVFALYTRFTDLVEPFGPDECWLDVTGSERLFGSGKQIADELRRLVAEETGLTISVGVSWNKIFAKLGSDLKKPDATTVLSKQNFHQLVFPLPVSDLMMVGSATAKMLASLNVNTIGDLASTEERILKERFGINGLKIKKSAMGLDDEPVREYHKHRLVESVGHGITASRDLETLGEIKVVVTYLSDLVGARMRKYGFRAKKISVDLRDNRLEHITRQHPLPYPTTSSADIAASAFEIAKTSFTEGVSAPLRTITVSVFDLEDDALGMQVSLFEEGDIEKKKRLDKSLDSIKKRFGRDAVRRANLMGVDFVYDKNASEDFLPFKR